jgi:hypothetical protein
MAGRVRDHTDSDCERDSCADHRWQDPDLATGALLAGHWLILYSRERPDNAASP